MRGIKRDRTLRTGSKYHLPIPTGPYPNISHIDIMTGTDKNDGVFVRVLYPDSNQTTDPKENCKEWPNWYPSDEYKTGYLNVAKITSPLLARIVNFMTSDVYIPIVKNKVPLRFEDQMFPVIIFSHGLASCRTTYSDICNELASYGFIVFVLEHREQSACTTFYPNKDGPEQFKWDDYKHFNQFGNELKERNEQLDQRITDIRRVIDLIHDLQNGNQLKNLLEPQIDCHRFVGLFDINKIVVMGHSFGGATTIRALLSIESIKLGVCLDSWLFPLKEFDASLVTKPILFVNMETFQTKNNLKAMTKFISNDGKNTDQRKVITIKKAKHTDQSDIPFIMYSIVKRILKMNSAVDPFVVHDLTTALSLKFISDQLQINFKRDKNEFIEKYQDHLAEGIEVID